jgi:hypothetical protein
MVLSPLEKHPVLYVVAISEFCFSRQPSLYKFQTTV